MIDRLKDRRGFTLIELMIVTAVLGILVGIAVPYYFDLKDKTTWMTARENMDVIRSTLISYNADGQHSLYPIGPLDFAGIRSILTKANLPPNELEAKFRTGSFLYTSADGLDFAFRANCANKGNDLLTATFGAILPYRYEDYEVAEEEDPVIGHYRAPRSDSSPGR